MLTIIIISYNSQHVLTRCLAPLIDSDEYPVLIIDNASTDGSAEALRERFPGCTVNALKQNIGYGRAANVGLSMTKTPYALLLNPDLKATPSDIRKLMEHAMNAVSNTAIWGPATQRSDFTQEPPESVEWISGSAMLFDLNKCAKLGWFDENIFLFFEETDLCRRIIAAGYSIKLARDVFFDHISGTASTPTPAIEWMKNWHYGWSRCYFFEKHGSRDGKRSPKRQYAQYRFKSLVSLNQKKRSKYMAQAAGAKAFLCGERSLRPDGSPRCGPRS